MAVEKVECQYCRQHFAVGGGITNHERGCQLNPARRPQKRRTRRICEKCRTMVDAGNYDRHHRSCKGRRHSDPIIEDEVVVVPSVLDASHRRHDLEIDLPSPGESTSELLVELLFPHGMPTHAEFVRAFRSWLDATDKLVAIAGIGADPNG